MVFGCPNPPSDFYYQEVLLIDLDNLFDRTVLTHRGFIIVFIE